MEEPLLARRHRSAVHTIRRTAIGGTALAVALLASSWLLPMLAASGSTLTAACTNTSQDAANLNAKISSTPVGSTIVIQGPCVLTQTVRLLGNRSYRGESRTGTVLRQANGANLGALLASDSWVDNAAWTGAPLSVRDLTLDGNKANNSARTNGIVLRSWQSVIEDVHTTSLGGSASWSPISVPMARP